ncbi:MAG: flagellar hook-length control protein FliK [Sedimentisphaerales bacterium]|nr:flagellar hook-length control protein FliK [Sedimentisphaerales bacterium]
MQIKDIKTTAPNPEAVASWKKSDHRDSEPFGMFFDMARYETARAYKVDSPSDSGPRHDYVEAKDVRERDSHKDIQPKESIGEPESDDLTDEGRPVNQEPVSQSEPESPGDDPSENNSNETSGEEYGSNSVREEDSNPVAAGENESIKEETVEEAMLGDLADQSKAVVLRDQITQQSEKVMVNSAQTSGTEDKARFSELNVQLQGNSQNQAEQNGVIQNTGQSEGGTDKGTNTQAVNVNVVSEETVPADGQLPQDETEADDEQDGSLMKEQSQKVDIFSRTEKTTAEDKPQGQTVENIVVPVDNEQDMELERKNRRYQMPLEVKDKAAVPETVTLETMNRGQTQSGDQNSSGSKNNSRNYEMVTSLDVKGGGEKAEGSKMARLDKIPATDRVDMQANVDRIVKAARTTISRGVSTIQLRLDPPELGTLRIEIRHSSAGLTLQLQASSQKAQELLQQQSGHLRTALEAQGFQNTQIEVQLRLNLQNGQHTSGSEQNHGQGQHNFQEQFQQDRPGQEQDQAGQDRYTPSDSRENESGSLGGEFTRPAPAQTDRQWREMVFSSVDVKI